MMPNHPDKPLKRIKKADLPNIRQLPESVKRSLRGSLKELVDLMPDDAEKYLEAVRRREAEEKVFCELGK